MPLIVNTNLAALNARRQLVSSNQQLDRATEQLASGRKINSARDDAAGLSISNRMTSQIRGLNQAIRNANDGISFIQVAEGALSESTNALQRIRELALQSANGLYSDADRSTLDAEVQQLVDELDRIAQSTTFNGQTILDGGLVRLDLQVGAEAEQTIELSVDKMDSQSLGLSTTNGQLTGSSMLLSDTGFLTRNINEGDILVNGRSIGSFDTSNNLNDLLNRINEDIDGVSARAITVVEANVAGTGVLSGNDQISFTAYDRAGSLFSFAVKSTDSMDDLVEAINTKGSGQLEASLDDQGRLIIEAEDYASITIIDTTNGTASGINAGISGGSPDEQAVVNALNRYWISESESLIQTYFGLAGTGVELDLNLYTDTGSSTVASVGYSHVPGVADFGTDLSLNINMHYFNAASMPNGGNYPLYIDRVIAHEMVHAVMTVQMDLEALPGWFTEGIPEFIHGADERVKGDIYTNGSIDPVKVNNLALKTTSGSPTDSEGYTAGYIAVRMLHDNIMRQTAGAAGVETVLQTLAGQGTATDLDAAISALGINWGSGTGLAAFQTHFNGQKSSYVNNGYLGPGGGGLTSSSLDVTNDDTGSIAGNDVDSSQGVRTAENILPNTGSSTPLNFTLNIPDEFSSGSSKNTARLELSSDYGDDVRIERGTNGRLRDLTFLGFQDMSDVGVIKGVGLTSPETAWGDGDVEINGYPIDPKDTNSLAGKLAAINAATENTGVRAESFASGIIDLSRFNFTQWATIAGAPDFNVNGVELTGIMGATTVKDILDAFNNVADRSGVTASLKGNDLLLESTGPIRFSNPSTANTADAFGFSNYGNAKFLSSTEDVAGSEPSTFSVDDSFAEAGIKLISIEGQSIQLNFDEPPGGTTGLMETNASADGSYGTSIASISVATQERAQKAITAVDNAMETINENRAGLGAANNRLNFIVSNLGNVVENTSAARSRIVDADFASTTSQLSRAQIMQQASSAMLAQANLRPQQILALLL